MEDYKVQQLLETLRDQIIASTGEGSCTKCPAFDMICSILDSMKDDIHYQIVNDLGIITTRRCPLRER